uniref:Transcriptional activator protein DAL81 n=1 Tax=Talaromyces marneffei PM1 TaxID=1077442 RepID=A0A093VFR4_TALMA
MPTGPPCKRCVHMNKACTFEEPPSQRKRRSMLKLDDIDPSILPLLHGTDNDIWRGFAANAMSPLQMYSGGMFYGSPGSRSDENMSPKGLEIPSLDETFGHLPGPSEFENNHPPPDANERISPARRIPTRNPVHNNPFGQQHQSHETSLEFVPDAFTFYIGPTGVSDVHLLDSQPYDEKNVSRLNVKGLRYRLLNPSSRGEIAPSTIFGITDQSLLDKAEPKVDYQTTESAWSDLWQALDPVAAWHLIDLYSRFVDPYFPIISQEQIPDSPDTLSNMPLGLLTAMCATALPFIMYNEALYTLLLRPPSIQELYRLAWLGVTSELHAPSLTTLQACLILLQRLPTNLYLSDTAFTWSLMSTAVSIAQTIGLHRDPSAWLSVPSWERQLRRRLWWALWTMEKWIALARGMPSHLHEDDSDVAMITMEDINDTLSEPCENHAHLPHLVSLTGILSDICRTYYTVRASNVTSSDLQYSLDAARLLRARLKAWRDNLPDTLRFRDARGSKDSTGYRDSTEPHQTYHGPREDLDGNGSLHLSYIVTHMTLFRALLRPLNKWPSILARSSPDQANAINEGARAVVRGALLCVKEFVEFMEALTETQWNAFWHSWSRPNFAIAGSFMVHVLHTTAPYDATRRAEIDASGLPSTYITFEEEYEDLKGWIRRWRWANRVSVNGAAGVKGLTNLGLMKAETLMEKMESSHFATDSQSGKST